MNPRQLHAELDRAQHLLADLPPDVREGVDVLLGRLLAGHLRVWALYEEALRRISTQQAPLATMVHMRSLN